MGETLETACMRELKEETGIVVKNMKQFRVFDAIDRDPRGRTISVVFYTTLHQLLQPQGGDDASDAQWFLIDKLPKLAFDHQDVVAAFLASGLVI